MELISIVIPIYNVEKYIKGCIESVINQTYKELEIILVNNEVLPLSKNRINTIKETYYDLLDERYY